MNYFKTTESRSLISSLFKISREKVHLLLYDTKKIRLTYIYYVIIYYMLHKRDLYLYIIKRFRRRRRVKNREGGGGGGGGGRGGRRPNYSKSS